MIENVPATMLVLIVLSACASQHQGQNAEQDQWTIRAVDPLSKPVGQTITEPRKFEREMTIIHPVFSLHAPRGWRAEYHSGHGTITSTEGVSLSPFSRINNAAVEVSVFRVLPHKFTSLSEVANEVTKNTKKSVTTIIMNGREWVTYSSTPNALSYMTVIGSDLWSVIVATDGRYPEYNVQASEILSSILFSPPKEHAVSAL